jgi:hypothetical protein
VPTLAACVFVGDPPDKVSGGERKVTFTVRSIAGASGRVVTADGTECVSGTVLSRPDGSSKTLSSPDWSFQSELAGPFL